MKLPRSVCRFAGFVAIIKRLRHNQISVFFRSLILIDSRSRYNVNFPAIEVTVLPTYGYQCTQCQHEFQVFQAMKDEPVKICPECGGAVKRLLYPVGIVFKGSGWYINDSRKPDTSETADKAAADKASGDASSDSKTTDSKPSDGLISLIKQSISNLC